MRNRTTPRAQRALTTSLSGLLAGALGLTLGLGLGTPTAHAGGYDWPGLGTRGMGRAGAWGVRSDSPLALHVNPANLARLIGINA